MIKMPIEVGLVGKPNTGKSTFFAAATLVDVKIAPYPFTTIEPNVGIAYVKIECVCREFGVKDNPRNSTCVQGWRFAPVKLIDVAGLVPGAWKGRGLGNKFLDELRRAPVLIHVVDASGSTDIEGRPVKRGAHDPLEDVQFLEGEIDMWILQNVKRDWSRFSRMVDASTSGAVDQLYTRLSGLGFRREAIEESLEELGLSSRKLSSWSERELLEFLRLARERSKPILIAANKADIPSSVEYIEKMREALGGRNTIVIPTSAESELALRRAALKGLIRYVPGEPTFEITGNLTEAQRRVLRYIEENVLEVWGSTGVQDALNTAVFDLLGTIAVFPVENESRLTDHKGNVLPDVFLVPKGTTARELAYIIHTDLGENFAFAIDVRTRKRLPSDHELEHRSVIKVVTSR